MNTNNAGSATGIDLSSAARALIAAFDDPTVHIATLNNYVRDLQAALARATPQHLDLDIDVEELALKHIAKSCGHSQTVTPYMAGEYKKTEQFRRLKAFAVDLLSRRATPQHSVTEQASIDTPEFRRLFGKYDSARGVANINHAYRDLIAYIDSRAQPLASTAAQPEQASNDAPELRELCLALRCAEFDSPYWHQVMGEMQTYINSRAALAIPASTAAPVDMILHCPACHMQHIDAPDERTPDWKNEPHRSHLCHGCGNIWRPADVPTNGVKAIATSGKNDSPAASEQQAGADERTQRRNSSGNAIVYVCPERDVECGRNQKSWCAKCPQHAALTHRATTAAVELGGWKKKMRDLVRVLRGVECGDDGQWRFIANVCSNAEELLAATPDIATTAADRPEVVKVLQRALTAALDWDVSETAAGRYTVQVGDDGEYELHRDGRPVGTILFRDDAERIMQALKAADQQGNTASEYTYLSLQADSFDEWDKHVVEAARGAQRITDLHFRIGGQEWKGNLCDVMAALQGAAQPQVRDALQPIVLAVTINDTDTLAKNRPDSDIIWTAEGHWGSSSLTMGDLRRLAELATSGQAGEAAEPNMLWQSDDTDVFANSPVEFANEYASNCLRPGESADVDVDCATRAGKRTMHIAMVDGGEDDHKVEWKWVERTTPKTAPANPPSNQDAEPGTDPLDDIVETLDITKPEGDTK